MRNEILSLMLFSLVFLLCRSEPHPSMKLMFVGVANIGKTTLLNQLRQEGTGSYQNSPPVGWTERKVKKRRTLSAIGKSNSPFRSSTNGLRPSFCIVQIGHFAVVCLVSWPWIESEAGVDLVLIETSLLFLCKCKLVSIRTA